MEEDINTLLDNKPEAMRYRRSLSTLIILGTGVIVFGFWGIIKLAAQLFFGIELFKPEDLEGFDETAKIIVTVLVFVSTSLRVLQAQRHRHSSAIGKKYFILFVFFYIAI